MDDFRSVVFENASGRRAILVDQSVSRLFEIGAREGFFAPEVDLVTQKYVGGQTKLLKSVKQPRSPRLTMIAIGESRAELDNYFRKMIEILMDTSKGEEGKLWVTRSDGLQMFLNCAYASGLNALDEYKKFRRFTLEFYAADYKYHGKAVEKALTGDYFTGITLSHTLTLGSWALGQGTMSGDGIITNTLGTVTNPIYKINGARSTLTIRNKTNGQSVSLHDIGTVASDTLVIDTREEYKIVYILHSDGTTKSAVDCLDWDNVELVLQLEPGANSISVSSLGAIGTLTITTQTDFISA